MRINQGRVCLMHCKFSNLPHLVPNFMTFLVLRLINLIIFFNSCIQKTGISVIARVLQKFCFGMVNRIAGYHNSIMSNLLVSNCQSIQKLCQHCRKLYNPCEVEEVQVYNTAKEFTRYVNGIDIILINLASKLYCSTRNPK